MTRSGPGIRIVSPCDYPTEKSLARAYQRRATSRGRSSSTSCARRWTMTSTCRNGREWRGGQRRAPPNICSADLVCGSRRYCGTGVRACERACRYMRARAHRSTRPRTYAGCIRKRSSRDFSIPQFAPGANCSGHRAGYVAGIVYSRRLREKGESTDETFDMYIYSSRSTACHTEICTSRSV